MTEHLTTVSCTDTDATQPPPAPGVDSIVGTGTGRYDGEGGYAIEFALQDGGEPGTNDRAALHISGPAASSWTSHLATSTGGNIQAHEDQTHKL